MDAMLGGGTLVVGVLPAHKRLSQKRAIRGPFLSIEIISRAKTLQSLRHAQFSIPSGRDGSRLSFQ